MQYIHCLRIRSWSRDLNTNFTIKYCFLGAVKFTKYADRDKHSYSGYRTGSDSHSLFFLILIGVKMLLFSEQTTVHQCIFNNNNNNNNNNNKSNNNNNIDINNNNNNKDTVVVGENPSQEIDDTTMTAEANLQDQEENLV